MIGLSGIIDTAVLIGGVVKDEIHYRKAKPILTAIDSGDIKDAYISDYILAEFLNFMRQRKGKEASIDAMDALFGSEIIVLKIQPRHIYYATALFRRNDRLSFTDCTTLALMKDKGINTIYTFDSGFDGIPTIKRKEEF